MGDYLVSVSKSITVDQQAAAPAALAKKAARNRFDLLLIVNDVLHTDKFHRHSNAKQSAFSKESLSFTPELIDLAASFITEKGSFIEKKLRAVINYWAVNQLVSAEDIKSLQDRADEALVLAQGGTPIRKRNYLLPEYHGDRAAPWHDLPASYMLEQMIRHPKRAIDPSCIKVVKFDKKPVSPHVRKLLDNYFENIDLKYLPTGNHPTGDTKKYKLSLDPLGQLVKQDKGTGESTVVYNGYGWSPKLCRDMQKHGVPEKIKIAREDIKRMEDSEDARDIPHNRGDERDYSKSPRRRCQSSSAPEYRRERGRSDRSRSRSYSRSRRGSGSSYDSHRSQSRSPNRSYGRRHRSSKDKRRDLNDRCQSYDDRGSRQPRPPPKPYGREFLQSESQWNGSNSSSRTSQGSAGGHQYHTPNQPPQGVGRGFSHVSQPPFNAPSSSPQVPPLGQFPGLLPSGQFPIPPPPPPPPLGGFPGSAVLPFPPPPPPNFSGSYHPPGSNIPNNLYGFSNQYGSQHGHNVEYGDNGGFGRNRGGISGARGGYGGNTQGSGFHGSRGGYGGHQRGQRGGRY